MNALQSTGWFVPSRRKFLRVLGATAAAATLGWPAARAATGPPSAGPNIVIILADDLGHGDVSCFGDTETRTPNLDALAASGLKCEQFYANSPVCSPTRAALLTGRYPDMVGVQGVTQDLMHFAPTAVTLPQILAPLGYHSALIGKWHLGDTAPNTPRDRGFHEFFGSIGGMLRSFTDHARGAGTEHGLLDGDTPVRAGAHATELETDRALRYVQQRAADRRPFFLYLSYHAPHTPVEPPPRLVDAVRRRHPDLKAERAQIVAHVEHLDEQIGRFLAGLRQAGLEENTIVVFTSDNGPSGYGSAKPWRGYKRQLFEGGIRVPCIVRWPGRIAPGRVTGTLGLTMDLLPTLCEAVGAGVPQQVDGISLLPTWLDQPQSGTDRYVFWMRRGSEPRTDVQAYYAVRRGRYKLLQNKPSEPLKLYDLESDPQERSALPDTHDAYGPLLAALRAHVRHSGSVPWQPEDVAAPMPAWPLTP